MNRAIRILFLIAALMSNSSAIAITPSEIFNDGKRAFNNSRWIEAEEKFETFLNTWPEHHLRYEAIYYQSISDTRSFKEKYNRLLSEKIFIWKANLEKIEKELPDKDAIELRVAIAFVEGNNTVFDWKILKELSPLDLKHYINREWYPNPSISPMKTLEWVHEWLKNNKLPIDPDLKSKLCLLQAKALWQMVLSPLSLSANSAILREWGYWPVYSHLNKVLNDGFLVASPNIKRQIALLGYHVDYFRDHDIEDSPIVVSDNHWYRYLSERGINLQESICPR